MPSTAQKLKSNTPDKADANAVVESVRTRYWTVALIGPDGSGKTTVAKALVESCPFPIKYLYMGMNVESSNVALPTSRLIHKWKVYRHKKSIVRKEMSAPKKVTLHGLEHRVDRRGKIGAFLRLLRRVSEESYRQLVSWIYQLQGYVVLYDRHFLFDACPPPQDDSRYRFTDRIHQWFLQKIYPRPSLAIFLDAPSDVLYARKQEVPLDYLERNRKKLLLKSCYAKKFVTLDSTQPLEDVIDLVKQTVVDHCGSCRTPCASGLARGSSLYALMHRNRRVINRTFLRLKREDE